MSDLLLPRNVQVEIQKDKWGQQRSEHRAKLDLMFDFDDRVCKRWSRELKRLDPLLRLGRAKPMAYEPGWTIIPGFYHWVRDNETAAPTVTPITGPNDSFAEPDSRILEDLRRCDLQNPAVFGLLLEQRKAQEAERERRVEAHREERQEEILDRYLAGTATRVSMNDASPWKQSVKGRR